MFRRTLTMVLAGMVLFTAFGIQHAGAQGMNDARAREKIKNKVQTIGVGGNARVEVKLNDGTNIKGHITEAQGDSFTVRDNMTGLDKTFAYSDTSSVKKAGGG